MIKLMTLLAVLNMPVLFAQSNDINYHSIPLSAVGPFSNNYSQELLDMVITSGQQHVSAVQFSKEALSSNAFLSSWNEKTLTSKGMEADPSVQFPRVETRVSSYRKSDIDTLAKIMAYEVNDFSPGNGMDDEIRGHLFKMLRELAGHKITAVSRVLAENSYEKYYLTVTTIINKTSGKALVFYTRQGRI